MADTFHVVRKRLEGEVPPDAPDPRDQYWAAFTGPAAAAAHAARLDSAHRLVGGHKGTSWTYPTDLFYDGPGPLTSLPDPVFLDWLADAGVPVPTLPDVPSEPPHPAWDRPHSAEWDAWQAWGAAKTKYLEAWREWWAGLGEGAALSPAQMARLWQALDKVPPFHEVVEVPAGRDPRPPAARPATAFAVVHHSWYFDDSHLCGGNEALTVYRTREAAEAERARRTAAQPADLGFGWSHDRNEFVVVELLLDPAED